MPNRISEAISVIFFIFGMVIFIGSMLHWVKSSYNPPINIRDQKIITTLWRMGVTLTLISIATKVIFP
jgi:hypothetical protein